MWRTGGRKGLGIGWAVLVAWWLVAALGCRMQTGVMTRQFDLQGAQTARVELTLHSGDLIVREGALGLAQARLTYDPAGQQPKLVYAVSQGRGLLVAAQPASRAAASAPATNLDVWDWALNSSIPLDLEIVVAGASHLDVGHLNLAHLVVVAGAGLATLDLDGPSSQELFVRIRAGDGEMNLLLPSQVGVLVDVQGDPSLVDAPGLTLKGTTLVSPAYGKASPTLHVALYTGAGRVRLRLAEPLTGRP